MESIAHNRADDLSAVERVTCISVKPSGRQAHTRAIPEEVPIAMSYNGTTHAVMMATPSDLMDFAVGFGISERIIAAPEQIESFEVLRHAEGVELRMWLRADLADKLSARRRHLAGPTGCGLCGMESLTEVMPRLPSIGKHVTIASSNVNDALDALTRMQNLHLTTGAMHAAGFFVPGMGLVALREDVGRHNALDKLIGCLAREKVSCECGIAVLTSRVSVELVQKAAVYGISAIIAISVPTALAVRVASQVGLTLIGVARPDGYEVFTQPEAVS
jgi:FdhD protein